MTLAAEFSTSFLAGEGREAYARYNGSTLRGVITPMAQVLLALRYAMDSDGRAPDGGDFDGTHLSEQMYRVWSEAAPGAFICRPFAKRNGAMHQDQLHVRRYHQEHSLTTSSSQHTRWP